MFNKQFNGAANVITVVVEYVLDMFIRPEWI